MIYSVEFLLGQALVEANSEKEAKEYSRREWGNANGPYHVTRATDEDIASVTGFGGVLHKA